MDTPQFRQAQKLRDNGQIDQAIVLYQEARSSSLKGGDKKSAAECLHMIGVAYSQAKKFSEADKYLQLAQDEFEESDNTEFFAFVLRDRGLVALANKNLDRAEELLKGSARMLKVVGNQGHEGISLVKLGKVYAEREEFEEALNYLQQGITLLNQSEDKFFLSSAYLDYAKVLLLKGDKAGAKIKLIKSLEVLNSFSKENDFSERRKDITRLLHEIDKK